MAVIGEENYPQTPTMPTNLFRQEQTSVISLDKAGDEFPSLDDLSRINQYEYYEHLFQGDHFTAFSIQVSKDEMSREYAKLRYVTANFAGLISKVVADMLFIEPPKIQTEDGDQDFIDALVRENKLRMQNYESAVANSYLGDNLYKIRVGKRNPGDDKTTVIIEETTPKVYFPVINPFNVKAAPTRQDLAWKFKKDGKDYVFKEIHQGQIIYSKVYLMEGNKIKEEVDLSIVGMENIVPEFDTKVKQSLIFHIPNWRAGNQYYGMSDYYDLSTLFFAINNRMSKVTNILDSHSDPILAIPDGILDEHGKVRKSKLGLFVRPENVGVEGDPKYITWDASLDNAFKEIDKLIEVMFMMSETSPDILGMGQGQSDSGRALKFKLLRTIAKTQRKQIYYTEALRDVIYTAQVVAKEWGLEVDGKKLTKDPVYPDIIWDDGLPADMTEMITNEVARYDAGLTSKTDSIMRLDDIDEKAAEAKAKEIQDEQAIAMPVSNVAGGAPAFGNKAPAPGTPPAKPTGSVK